MSQITCLGESHVFQDQGCHSLAESNPWNEWIPHEHSDESQDTEAGVMGQLFSLQLETWETPTLLAATLCHD